jgi:hypothetical protein
VFDRETIEFLESGCSLVVGTVASDGEPFACRGWGVTVVGPDENRVRLVLDAADEVMLDNMTAGGRVALTAADVRTLRSMQFKGHVRALQPADEADRSCAENFSDAFFDAVMSTDGTDRRLLERLVPLDFVVCDLTVDEFYNQTPGPGAGCAVSSEPT